MTSELTHKRIKLLPDTLINRIAAGEVVERPSAVLKELVENSLDAGADRIEIEVAGGGKRLIRVKDNGRGMDEDDLFMCLERHATSKLSQDDDLMNIATLGFRGEALPSIGSVSRLSIISATEGGEGRMVTVGGGRLENMKPVAANRGTTIEVANLFYNVPARRKFLKTDHTENAHLLEVAQCYALSREGLSLSYREGGKEVMSVEARHDFKTRVYRVLGRAAAESLVPIDFNNGDLTITGWLGPPERALRSTANMFLYVLGRPVKDRLLNRAVIDGFGRLIPPGHWPTAIIFIDLPPSEVDVNVHPAKAEVRFRRPSDIFSALSTAVGRIVGHSPQSYEPDEETLPPSPTQLYSGPNGAKYSPVAPKPWEPEGAGNSLGLSQSGRGAGEAGAPPEAFLFEKNEEPQPPWLNDDYLSKGKNRASTFASEAQTYERRDDGSFPPAQIAQVPLPTVQPIMTQPGEVCDENPDQTSILSGLRPLAQLYNSYILAEGPRGLYVIDQHAAHERILFNQLRARLTQGLPGQALLFPDTMDLPPQQALAAEKIKPHLGHIGFELDLFGERTFILKSAPAILGGHDPWPPLLEILGAASGHLKFMEGAGLIEAVQTMANSWFYSLACRAAIKAGDKMSLEEMAGLIRDMAATSNGAYCPHGRPAIWLMERHNLEKKFDRR